MKVVVLPLGPYQTNCYIVYNEDTKECIVFDPGYQGEALVDFLRKENFIPKAVVLTHAHSDHIGGIDAVVNAYHVPLYMNKIEGDFLTSPALNLSDYPDEAVVVKAIPQFVAEGDVIEEAGLSFTVIETPGHTPGGTCYYAKEGLLIAGDTLFQGSIGRTDFPGGSYEDLLQNIKEKLYRLPKDTVVCPGHGPQTTIGEEIVQNPFTR